MERPPGLHGTPLTRAQRTLCAFALFLAILVLQYVVAEQNLVYAQLIPLLYIVRAHGKLGGMIAACVSAPLLCAFAYWNKYGLVDIGVADGALACTTIFVAVLIVVDRYDNLLERMYRREAERRPASVSEETFRELAERWPHFAWTQLPSGPIDYVNARWLEYSPIFDPVELTLAYASPRHPSPLVKGPDGTLTDLHADELPPGVRRKGDTTAAVATLAPGTFVVFYTEGLIEATHDLAQGEQRLQAAVEWPNKRDPSPAKSIRRAVLRDEARHDVAILTLYVGDAARSGHVQRWTFDSSDLFAARRAQGEMTNTLIAVGAVDTEVHDAELISAELIGNAVRHAPGRVDVILDTSGALPVLSVLDRGPGFALTLDAVPDTLNEGGRGLFIARSVAADLTATRRLGGGCHVRAVLTLDAFGVRTHGSDYARRAAAS